MQGHLRRDATRAEVGGGDAQEERGQGAVCWAGRKGTIISQNCLRDLHFCDNDVLSLDVMA